MKISFEGVTIPPDPDTFPLPEKMVLGEDELEETRERMREWLSKYDNRQGGTP